MVLRGDGPKWRAGEAQGIEVERAPAESKKRIILNGWHLTFNVSRHARVHARARGPAALVSRAGIESGPRARYTSHYP